jgi:hypothetical protein
MIVVLVFQETHTRYERIKMFAHKLIKDIELRMQNFSAVCEH